MYLILFRIIGPIVLRILSGRIDVYLAERHERRLTEKAAQQQAKLAAAAAPVIAIEAGQVETNPSPFGAISINANALAYTASAVLLGGALGLLLVLLFKHED
jgi:hypothetical protein